MLNRLILVGILAATFIALLLPGRGALPRALVAAVTGIILAGAWKWAHAELERIRQRRFIFGVACVVVMLFYREAMVLLWVASR